MLKYLFTAIYNDETTYEQSEDDLSKTTPGRSAFFDIDHDKLLAFAIHNDTDVVLVRLDDGSFEINGLPFTIYDGPVENRRLIYFRRHRHAFNVGLEELDHEVEYHIGWQGNEPGTGNNIQKTLIIK